VSTLAPPRERLDRGERSGLGRPWLVIVLNDDHNTFQGVALALSSVVPGVSYEQGLKLADRIHNSGQAIVWSGHQEQAELYWEQLQAHGLVTDPADLFFLTKEQLLDLDRFAEKSASNIHERIQHAKRRPLARIINALGIPQVGWQTSEDLARWCASRLAAGAGLSEVFALLRSATAEDLQAIPGVGAKVADAIRGFLTDASEIALMDKLVKAEVVPVLPPPPAVTTAGPFAGKTIVFTGTLERRSREDAEELVRGLGAKTSGSVSAKTDLLVAGPGAGTKLDKAKQLGVKVVDEEGFEAMLTAQAR